MDRNVATFLSSGTELATKTTLICQYTYRYPQTHYMYGPMDPIRAVAMLTRKSFKWHKMHNFNVS